MNDTSAFVLPHIPLLALAKETWREHQTVILALLFLFYASYSWFTSETRKLRHIPTVGISVPGLSLISTFQWYANSPKFLDRSTKAIEPGIYKIPEFIRWVVVLSDEALIEELRKAPEKVLSAKLSSDDTLQVKYTLGSQFGDDPYHVPIVKGKLTKSIPELVPVLYEEVGDAFGRFLPATEDWTSYKVLENVMHVVARASNRVFVGEPLCRNKEYCDIAVQYTIDVVQVGTILRVFPEFMKPFVNRAVSPIQKRTYLCLKHLLPMINERREAMAEKGLDYPDQPNDMLMWLMDAANLEAGTDYQLAWRMLAINFAAIHTSSMTFTQAFYYLAVEPEKYLQPLRDEVEDALEREGWTKSALDQMYKVDSFIKESQRLHSMASLLLSRMTAVDYTFSNGVTVPEGTLVAANLLSRHLDPTRFPNPETFDGFRHARERELALSSSGLDNVDTSSEIDRKAEMVTPNIDFLAFGHGRHACPGRWFAAAELKIMLAYTVLKYDVKMKEGEGRPKDLWFGAACLPNARAEVLFRRRKA